MKTTLQTAACIASLLLPLTAPGSPMHPVEDLLDETVEKTVEEAIEETVEQSVEDLVDEEVEDAVDQAVEEAVTETVEETVGETVEQSIADSISESVDSTVTQAVEESVGNEVSSALEQAVENAVEQAVETTITDSVAKSVSEGVEQTVDNIQGELLEGDGALPGFLTSLPERLPVKSQSGKTVFFDVAVENDWRAVQGEWLLILDDRELATLEMLDVEVLERVTLKHLGMVLVRFRVDNPLDAYPALREHFPEAMGQRLDRNHIYNYRPQTGAPTTGKQSSRRTAVCEDPLKIGVVDTAVNTGNTAFSGVDITLRNFLEPGIESAGTHGTAVAGILVGKGDGLQATLPNASLAVASVIYQRDDGSQGSTILSILKAFDWLASEQVGVINMSIAGPPNALLERAVNMLSEQSIVVVAAVGNEGPAAPPRYPAAYDRVIGATAVDSKNRIYRWANRGEQVDFAARGVAVNTINDSGGTTLETGTSMATPVVASFVACLLGSSRQNWNSKQILDRLSSLSFDLGAPGKDHVFGFGLLE